MNEILWFILLFLNFVLILVFYRFFGRTGLLVWTPITIILANILVLKTVSLVGISATLGNIVFAASFLITDILSEVYGKKSARLAVIFGFITQIVVTLILNIGIAFVPNAEDISQVHLEAIFGFFPAITIASLLAYGLSQFHDIWAYEFWKKLRPDFHNIWIRNNLSTIVSQLIDSIVFIFIAVLLGVFQWSSLLILILSTYITKLIVAILDTPFIYIATWIQKKGWVLEA